MPRDKETAAARHPFYMAGRHDEPGFTTISQSRNRARDETDDVLTRSVLMLVGKGFVREYIGGTKMEFRADGCAFVWRKAAERNCAKPAGKMAAPPSRTDGIIARDDASKKVEFTPGLQRVLLMGWDSRPDSYLVQKTRGGRSGRGDLGRDVTS